MAEKTPVSTGKDAAKLNLDTARLPDPDIAATGDGRVIAAALNTLTSELRLTNLLLAQSMQNALGQIVYASHHDAISEVVRERLLHMAPARPPCDHEGIDHGSFSYTGICPSCGLCKFIGHGPLCTDCLRTRVTAPATPASQEES